jgi:uncharacterized protein (DUF2164 family)
MPTSYEDNPARIRLSDERKQGIIKSFNTFYYDEFDEKLSEFRAEQILDFFIKVLGPAVYNQAIQDARAFITEKLEDLDAEFFVSD